LLFGAVILCAGGRHQAASLLYTGRAAPGREQYADDPVAGGAPPWARDRARGVNA